VPTSPSTPLSSAPSIKSKPSPPSPTHQDTFKWFDNVIFESNNVFLISADDESSDKHSKSNKYDIITSLPWSKFERAVFGLEECRSQVVERSNISEDEVDAALSSAMSWQVSPEMFLLAAQLKTSHKVHAVRRWRWRKYRL